MVLSEAGPGAGQALVSRQVEPSWPPVKVTLLVSEYEKNVMTAVDGPALTNSFLRSGNRARPEQVAAHKRRRGKTCRCIDDQVPP